MKELLIELNACQPARDWAADKTWEEVYNTCHRGDWLLWLFQRTNPNDLQLLTLAKGHVANTVRHLMKDQRSLKAVDAAIAFGEGRISREELDEAADAAADAGYAAAWAADAVWAARAAYYAAANAAADADDAATYAARADAAATYAARADAAADGYEENQKLTADICRKYLPIEIWNIKL